MELVISEHLKGELVRSHALLSSYLLFYYRDDKIFYANKRYAANSPYDTFMIMLGDKEFMFDKRHNGGKIRFYDSNNIKTITWGDYGGLEFIYNPISFELYYTGDLVKYRFSNPRRSIIDFTKDGKVRKLDTKYLQYTRSDAFITIGNRKYNKESLNNSFNIDIAELLIKTYSNGELKMYETKVNKILQGISYTSDESGDFTVSSYFDGKLHGYYYNTFNDTEGFYENGIKVGFWKERGRIVNYDRDRIFFLFPVFIS